MSSGGIYDDQRIFFKKYYWGDWDCIAFGNHGLPGNDKPICSGCRVFTSGNAPLIDLQSHNEIISECDIFLNGGSIENSNESTIVKIENKKIRILRKGAISEKKIVEVI